MKRYENKKIYNYSILCHKCKKMLSVYFEARTNLGKVRSIGYCTNCDFPVIVGKKENYDLKPEYEHET